MLASNCPGWICYAEKTHPEAIPYISTCRSPQQIVGRALKGFWLPTVNQQTNAEKATHTTTTTTAINSTASSAKLIHVTIMPCPDKKLEASRRDFFEAGEEPDVNLVLTTTEVLEMITSGTEKKQKEYQEFH